MFYIYIVNENKCLPLIKLKLFIMSEFTSVIKRMPPTEVLADFISEYVWRELIVPQGQSVIKFMPLRVTGSIDFFLGDSFDTVDCHSKQPEPFLRCTIRGPRTYKKYTIEVRDYFVSFTIKFTPTGLYRLLGMPANLFINRAIDEIGRAHV